MYLVVSSHILQDERQSVGIFARKFCCNQKIPYGFNKIFISHLGTSYDSETTLQQTETHQT